MIFKELIYLTVLIQPSLVKLYLVTSVIAYFKDCIALAKSLFKFSSQF